MTPPQRTSISQEIDWTSAFELSGIAPFAPAATLAFPRHADAKALRMASTLASGEYHNRLAFYRLNALLGAWLARLQLNEHEKRAFDIIVSCLALIVAVPLIGLAAMAIKFDSPGPVFFRQERVGKWGRRFTCYKLRSMYIDAEARKAAMMADNEADEIVFKVKRDARVTRVGRIIRKLSIDELPQVANILKGEMSIVGPRPPIPYEVNLYSYDHLQRLDAVPGLTGLQQVSGRSDISFKRWVELDMQYINEQSLRKDVHILLMTIPAVLTGKGAY